MHCVGLCGTIFFNGCKFDPFIIAQRHLGFWILIGHVFTDDGSLFNGLQSIDQWQSYFGHPSSNILGLMNSAGYLPGLFASFIADRFGFYFGRKMTVRVGTTIVVRYHGFFLNTFEP